MSEIKELREKHLREIEELQTKCIHEHITDWIEHQWAPGHANGYVKVCKNCDKIIE